MGARSCPKRRGEKPSPVKPLHMCAPRCLFGDPSLLLVVSQSPCSAPSSSMRCSTVNTSLMLTAACPGALPSPKRLDFTDEAQKDQHVCASSVSRIEGDADIKGVACKPEHKAKPAKKGSYNVKKPSLLTPADFNDEAQRDASAGSRIEGDADNKGVACKPKRKPKPGKKGSYNVKKPSLLTPADDRVPKKKKTSPSPSVTKAPRDDVRRNSTLEDKVDTVRHCVCCFVSATFINCPPYQY